MHRIGLIVYPGFQVLGLAMCATFELANSAADEPVYSIVLVSEHGGMVQTSAGFAVETKPFDPCSFDTLLVMGDNLIRPPSKGLVDFLRHASQGTRRLGSICTGAIALAEAGLLDGRRATTHWCHAASLQRAFPKVKVEEDRIFINDGNIWTAAGMSACVDLALALVEIDLGAEVARRVARQLVVYHRRAGGQSQFSVMLELQPRTDRIQAALTYAKQNLKSDLSVEELANAANLSPRQFSRVFNAETGQSPAKAIESLRVEAARLMMETGRHSIDVVATETGFGDRERMRRAFLRAFGQPPQVIQRANRG
ncbi:AraC family transcriptional regulator [Pseudomonas umsongensis]|jgi:transcriptional regulator GlxA family with amidase domain|uniref:AraC family transcriptional regulator n=1 Tax=Pseudomonas umsongensis TaxID=198618 RepID=A0AAE6ZWG6_9PSED|nr:GlxA family transcriptional regulator [Pseudomonas umsongensis]KEX92764.1 AraC family transcriptional regulator [Pseudomonas putida]OXR35571.1 AraC family transcriptional regulator [Pseudomonas umsongensis]QJC80020.1 GlxA family transcriptional regulator [Pseudomonas umsongensis]SDT38484.1 Transcriptional regulator GlxA family, contains an amidase domain and an AraC-type DNA-binding HTH domain [Pseudomonas umsongensis]